MQNFLKNAEPKHQLYALTAIYAMEHGMDGKKLYESYIDEIIAASETKEKALEKMSEIINKLAADIFG